MTNLNGAGIFRIIQQSDGAAVFPLEIPDAATHESVSTSSRRNRRSASNRNQNNKNSTPAVASECHIEHNPGSPERPAATDSGAEAFIIVVPLSLSCSGPVRA